MEGPYYMDRTVTDSDAEKMIARLAADTRQLLRDHQLLLTDLAVQLQQKGALKGAEISEIAKLHRLDARVEAEGYLHAYGYNNVLAATSPPTSPHLK